MEDQAILETSNPYTAFNCEFWINESEKRRCTSNLVEKGNSIGFGVFGTVYMGMNLDSGGYLLLKSFTMQIHHIIFTFSFGFQFLWLDFQTKCRFARITGVESVEVDLSIQVVTVLGSSPVKSMFEALEQIGQKNPIDSNVARSKGNQSFDRILSLVDSFNFPYFFPCTW
ncbi:unnamed protein product [Ilex paraguariensis]|uniref:Uncharacterized protein n=1 Tax=Ilex paraguariensis TaxID=185542 RepID=A0ABC8T5V5_9AQUA